MALFGLTLKKIEGFGENIWHDLTGSGNSGGASSGGGGGGGGGLSPYNPSSYSAGGPLAPSGAPNVQQRMAPQQQGVRIPGAPAPNLAFLRPPQQQGPGFTPKGMHRDEHGNLVPDTQAPQSRPGAPSDVDKLLSGAMHAFTNVGAAPVNFVRGAFNEYVKHDPQAAMQDYQLAHQDAANNIIADTGKAAVNTVKGEILLPAKSLYQDVVEHNPAASRETFNREAETSMRGFGSAAAVPAYAITKSTGNKNQKDAAYKDLGISPHESGLNQGAQLVGDVLNTTAPLGVAALKGKGAGRVAEAGKAAPKSMSSDDLDTLNKLDKTSKTRVLTFTEKTQRANLQAKKDSITTTTTPKTEAAFQRLNDLYNHKSLEADNANNLINKSIGVSRNFSRAGNDLQAAMEEELTPTERTAVRDTLEGQPPKLAKGDDMEKVQTVARMSKDLADKGYDVLDKSSKTGIHRVQQYATRLANFNGNKPTASLASRGFSNLKSLFNIHSGFANSRAIGKFVGEDGSTKYGTKTDLGLKPNKNGDLVDKNGVVHTPQAVSTSELKQNGFNYEDNYGRIANTYHTSVGRVKVAQAAKEELLNNPEKYGLVKGDVAPPKGYEPIRQVPELDGYFAPAKDAKAIDTSLGHPHSPGLIERGWQGINNGVIQSIVYNPLFHARNLNELAGLAAGKAKNSPFGGAIIKKAYLDLAQMTKEDRGALDDRMNNSGVVHETYGTDRSTVLSNVMDSIHLPHVNKASSAAMAHIDWNIRSSLFHLATTGKRALKDEDAAALVNHFLGDRANAGPISRNVGLFWHYFKTRTGVVVGAAKHPIAERGTIMTAAVQAAVLFAATKAFQEWTGNKHASLGHPGVFGLETDASNVIHGRPNAVAASKLNPLVITALNQLYGEDLYTGKALDSGKARLDNAKETLFAPTQTADKIQGGKQTPAQAGLQVLTGISLPHTKGSPAIPNENNPLAPSFNAKGATPAADYGNDHDPTGIDQATLYYKAKDAGLKALTGNAKATDIFNAYLDSEATPGGDKMKASPAESMGIAEALSGSPAAMGAMQKFQKSNPTHDPMWDLSQKDLTTFLKTQGSSSSSGVKAAHEIIDTGFNNGEGLKDFLKRRDAYYGSSSFPESKSADNPETPKYPTFSGQQLLDYNLYKAQFQNADPKTKSAWLQAHPDVVEAISSLGQYYNDLNFAQTGLRTKDSETLPPDLQKAYTEYNALPKGNGKYGGSPDRSAWIKAHQDVWNAITAALGQGDLVGLAKQGAVNQYQGVEWTPQFLKDAYNAGHYDIAPVTNSDGSKGYAFNPPAASAANSASSSSYNSKTFTPYARHSSAKQEAAYQRLSDSFSKYRAQVKLASQARDAEHVSKANKNLIKGVQRSAKLHGPKRMSIHMSGETKVSPHRVKGATLAARKVTKVTPKTQKALKSRNHAKLKA